MSFFFLSFAKLKNKRVEEVLPEGVDTSGRGEEVGKGYKKVNTMQILCAHVCKLKNDTC
jgi:hypothetical protein